MESLDPQDKSPVVKLDYLKAVVGIKNFSAYKAKVEKDKMVQKIETNHKEFSEQNRGKRTQIEEPIQKSEKNQEKSQTKSVPANSPNPKTEPMLIGPINGKIPSLLESLRLVLVSHPEFRSRLCDYYEDYFKTIFESQIIKDPYRINEFVLYYSTFPQVRNKYSIFHLFSLIENFELAFLDKSKGRQLPEKSKLNLKGGDKDENEREDGTGNEDEDKDENENENEDKEEDDATVFLEPMPSQFEPALINIWRNYSTFVLEHLTPSESEIPKLQFGPPPFRPSPSDQLHSINPKNKFLKYFHVFTNKQFLTFKNWSNMCIIGGTVVASALPVPDKYANVSLEKYFHEIAYLDSDIDIYIYGLSDEDFHKKVIEIYDHLVLIHGKVVLVRTPFTITFCTQFPNRHIQIVIGKWNNLEEVLLEPDIDCSCIAFDGRDLWTTQRGRLSYNWRVINTSKRAYRLRMFPEYEERLIKYSRRGFSIIDRKLKWEDVSEYYIEIGKERLLEHEVVRGRADIFGLRLLICGFKYPEVLNKVDIFKPTQWKKTGLVYGPKWTVHTLKEQLKQPILETSHYGPYEVKNPFQQVGNVRDMKLSLIDLDDPNKNSWRRFRTWYFNCFNSDRKKELREEALSRVKNAGYLLKFGETDYLIRHFSKSWGGEPLFFHNKSRQTFAQNLFYSRNPSKCN